ncbi:hypothetical protein PAEPH01_2585 [Pancytospora epiphaga]|nr:hypothetical protein PAEPH01_2585 [Pancytospora epiphaga]
MLQLVNMPINDLSVKFSNLLLKCRYLHTIRLNTQKYENGFFAVLLKEPEKSLVRHIGVCFEYKSWCFSQNIFENSTEYVNEEMIIRYVDKKDKDAITEARERGVYVGLRFFIN